MTITKQRHSAAFKARVALEAAKQTRTLAEPSCAEPRGRHSTRGRPGSGAGRPAPSTFPPPRGNPAFLRARCFRCELARSSATSGRNDASWSYTTLRSTSAAIARVSPFLRLILLPQPDSRLALARENGSLPGRDRQ